MAVDVVMPRLSDSMEEGTILQWLKAVGDEVKRGDELVEIETDKANMTYEADTDGTLIEIVAGEGETLPIGEVIARIGDPGEKPAGKPGGGAEKQEAEKEGGEEGDGEEGAESDRDQEEIVTESEERAEPARAEGGDGASANGAGERVKASPVARRMARDLGVELARLEGSGPGGRIVKADVEAAVRREGDDVTIVGISRMALTAEKAAEELATEHEIDAEVIDPRTLRPLDLDTILESVRKTNRAVIVEEGWPHGGVGANLAALIQEQAFDYLDAPVERVTGADVPMPYSKPLEQAAFPHAEHVVQAALATFKDV